MKELSHTWTYIHSPSKSAPIQACLVCFRLSSLTHFRGCWPWGVRPGMPEALVRVSWSQRPGGKPRAATCSLLYLWMCRKAVHNCQWVCVLWMSLHLMTFYLDGIMSIYMQCSLHLEYPPSPHLYQLHLIKYQHTFRSQGNVPSSEMTSLTPQANCPSYSYSLCQALSSLAVACNYAFIWVIFFYLCLSLPLEK